MKLFFLFNFNVIKNYWNNSYLVFLLTTNI